MRARSLIPVAATGVLVSMLAGVSVMAQSPHASSGSSPDGIGEVTLTLLHNNDGESSLLPLTYAVVGQDPDAPVELAIGGVAAFQAVTEREIASARELGNSLLNVYAGDSFLASAALACSLPPQPADTPVYDAVAQSLIPYDVHIFGNHEFDYGPDFLERFVRAFGGDGPVQHPFLSANLDFAAEPGWADLLDQDGLLDGPVTDERVVARAAVMTDTVTGERFGIVGATTWTLPSISSPRHVVVTPDLATTAAAVQAEIDRLHEAGVNRVILVSHLQDVDNDKLLVSELSGVDVAVAGGGDEMLLSEALDSLDQLLPGETQEQEGAYPVLQPDRDGRRVPIVTTAGNYKYLGRVDVVFGADGEVARIDEQMSFPRRVIPTEQDGSQIDDLQITNSVPGDPEQVAQVVEPVIACLDAFATTPVAASEVVINVARGSGDPYALGVRSGETNGGNLVADSYIAAYDRYAEATGLQPRDPATSLVIAVQNGGGIRQNAGNALPDGGNAPGVISRLDTLNVMAFDNYMVTVDLDAAELKTVFERSCETIGGGQFLQVSQIAVSCDLTRDAGSRVTGITFTAGTPETDDDIVIVGEAGMPQEVPPIRVVTIQFTAAGGDDYPTFASKRPTQLTNADGEPIFYEQAWREYLESFPVAGDPAIPTIPASDARYAAESGEGDGSTLVLPPAASPSAAP